MHAIKRKARHIAHRRDDDAHGRLAKYIPFAKQFTPPPSQHGDPETGRRVSEHSTGCIEDDAETHRIGQRQAHINHASTMPVSPTDYDEKRDQSEGTLGADSPSSTAVGAENPTRRRRFAKLGGLLGKDSAPELDRSSSSRSRRTLVHKKFPFWQQMKAIFWSPVNILLIAVPIGIAFGALNEEQGFNDVAVFVVNFIAIIPLAGLLSYATEEVAMRVGETLGGLLNASFGNAVELITAIIALKENQITIVKTSLIGSMLSNLLLVLGMCFLFGGIHRDVQHFNVQVAQTAASLLALAVGSLLIPTFFDQGTNTGAPANLVPPLSHGVAVVLLVVYIAYLYFQLSTHKDTYNKPSEKSPKKSDMTMARGIATIGAGNAGVPGTKSAEVFQGEVEDEVEEPRIHIITAVLLLILSTAFVGVCSEFLVDAIPAITENSAISAEFVGLILLPIVGNAAEHATAVTVAIKDKMDLAIGVAIGSSLQIVLLVLPLVTIIGWGLQNNDMTLEFDVFLIGLLFVSILLVNYLIGDGESHWLEGVMLIAMYILIAVAAWFYPAPPGVV